MRMLFATGILLTATAALAAAPAPWAQEPSSVIGVELGKPFPNSSLIGDCPTFEPFRREPQDEGLCVDTREGFSADRIALKNVPLDAAAGKATVLLHDGLVRALLIPVAKGRYEAMRSLLIERYGPPHSRAGASAAAVEQASEALVWTGARLTLTLRERGEHADGAILEVRDKAAAPHAHAHAER